MTSSYFGHYITHIPHRLDGRDVTLTCHYQYTEEEKPSFYSPGNGDYVEILEISIQDDIPGVRSPKQKADKDTFNRLSEDEDVLQAVLEEHYGYLSEKDEY